MILDRRRLLVELAWRAAVCALLVLALGALALRDCYAVAPTEPRHLRPTLAECRDAFPGECVPLACEREAAAEIRNMLDTCDAVGRSRP